MIETKKTYLGDVVICDCCNKDFTNSDALGGFLFGSKAVCPECAPALEASAKKYNELAHIHDRAAPEETFRDFVYRLRGGEPAAIEVTTFDNVNEFWEFMNKRAQ